MREHDIIIIGSGSGNSLLTPEWDGLDVAIVDGGTFGGTCLNVGCIPTKMYVYPAEVAQSARDLERLGVQVTVQAADWPAIRDRIFGRIDPISQGGLDYRRSLEHVTVHQENARFTAPRVLRLDSGLELTAPTIVLANGSRTALPGIPGMDLPQVHTSDTVMRLERLPRRVVVVGGGYIAAEFAHVFHGLGAQVVQLNRTDRVLREHDDDIAAAFAACASAQWDLVPGQAVEAVESGPDGAVTVRSRATGHGQAAEGAVREDVADVVLMATGRRPNGDTLDPRAAGIGVDPDTGLVRVDRHQRVLDDQGRVVEGLWALGDVSSPFQLKHVANHEAKVVAHNVIHPEQLRASDHRFVPAAVFTHPQIASVGMTESQARAWAQREGRRLSVKVQRYGDVAYGWAMEDQEGLCKLIADRATGRLLGAHLIGEQAPSLIQPLVQAMSFDLDARTMATGQHWPHPALTEVIENALLGLELDD